MKQGTKRLLSMSLALLFIVLAFVAYFELTQPAYQQIDEFRKTIQGQKKFLAEQQPAVKTVLDLIENYISSDGGDVRERVSQVLPVGQDVGASLVQLEGLVRESGLSLQGLSPQAVRGQTVVYSEGLIKPLGTLGFKLSFVGTYSQIKSFLSKLENNILIFEVRSMSVQPAAKQIDLFNVSLEIASYYQQK